MQLQIATREKVKLRMSIASPTGFGKTYSALLLAFGITSDWSKIAVVDTENRSASLYAHLGKFNTIPLEPPFTTEKYIQAIDICEKAGIEVIILDSVTHVWKGEGGLLQYVDSLGGRYQDWAKATPLYQKWLNRILHSSAHVITCMRKKQAYAMVTDNGKTKVEKKGLEDEIRDGFDYEMTVAFEINNDKHMTRASKDRTGLFDGKPEFVITPETGKMIKAWCETGTERIAATPAAAATPITAHNHTAMGTPAKPQVTNANFKKITDRIKAGEIEVYPKAMEAYSFDPTQKLLIDALYEEQTALLQTN